ncbi:hypothetical protein IKQ21_03590, partial [bacterium]|nr:hypothetical protein [bacterium]
MSTIGDYRIYKQYEPAYNDWKLKRDILNAKRVEYLRQHPEERNEKDIQRAKSLLRAIDIMDEYSQKRAEDMEVATENIVQGGLSILIIVGSLLGYSVCKYKPI